MNNQLWFARVIADFLSACTKYPPKYPEADAQELLNFEKCHAKDSMTVFFRVEEVDDSMDIKFVFESISSRFSIIKANLTGRRYIQEELQEKTISFIYDHSKNEWITDSLEMLHKEMDKVAEGMLLEQTEEAKRDSKLRELGRLVPEAHMYAGHSDGKFYISLSANGMDEFEVLVKKLAALINERPLQ